jgi:hypothetical protein
MGTPPKAFGIVGCIEEFSLVDFMDLQLSSPRHLKFQPSPHGLARLWRVARQSLTELNACTYALAIARSRLVQRPRCS